MTTTWRFIRDGSLPGARNMARDVAMLEAVAHGEAPPTLRLYGWDPPCLSLGRHQGLEAADLAFCSAHGIDVVRRPTGGRALLHHLELTYAVVAPLGEGPLPRALQDAYRRICEPLVAACRGLGIAAELTPGEVNLQLLGPASTIPAGPRPAAGGCRRPLSSARRCGAHGGAVLSTARSSRSDGPCKLARGPARRPQPARQRDRRCRAARLPLPASSSSSLLRPSAGLWDHVEAAC
jgi:lipoate-protein ligase A